MFKSGTVVISVPADELRHAELPGSLFEASELAGMPISEGLKRAVALIASVCRKPLCLVRPEIFNHGHARQWLTARLNGTREHICLSDGTSVKVIEGLDNHVFFYGLGQCKGSSGLQNLSTWAPEIFSHVKSQINSFHAVQLDGRLVQPPTTLSLPAARLPTALPEMFRYVCNPQCLDACARLITEAEITCKPTLDEFKQLTYIPLSESGSHDAAFSRVVARIIAAAYFNPEQCVLLRVPEANENMPDLAQRIIRTLEAIGGSGIVTPRVVAKNIFLLRSDLPESVIDTDRRWSLVVDDTFDFWRYTRRLYPRLHELRYLYRGDPRLLADVVRGLSSVVGRPPRAAEQPSSTEPCVLTWVQAKTTAARKPRKR